MKELLVFLAVFLAITALVVIIALVHFHIEYS